MKQKGEWKEAPLPAEEAAAADARREEGQPHHKGRRTRKWRGRKASSLSKTCPSGAESAEIIASEGTSLPAATDSSAAQDADMVGAAPKEKRTMLCGVELAYIAFLGIIMAFLGWVVENSARVVSYGVIDSRFHILPFIPVYGLVAPAIQLCVGDLDDMTIFGKKLFTQKTKKTAVLSNLLALLLFYFFVFFGELIVGNAWELLTGAQLWNYETHFLHFTQYASLPSTLGYGTGAYLLTRFCFRPAVRLLQRKANYRLIVIIDIVMVCLFLFDDAAMMVQTVIFGEAPVYWSIHLW